MERPEGGAETPTRQRTGLPATVAALYHRIRRHTRDWLDRPMTSFHLLLAVFFLLLGVGLLMVLSSSSVVSYNRSLKDSGDGSSFGTFKRQLVFAGIGLVAFYAAMRVKLSWLRAVSTGAMIVSILLLVVVLGMGKVNGARSWIYIGPIGFQPSEIAKFALVIWGAHVLASRRANLGSLKDLLIPVLPVAVVMAGLIVIEPDLGTTAALMVILLALFWFAGASLKLFAALISIGVGGIVVLAIVEPYRLKRVVSFLNPEDDPRGSGMQLLQGLYGMADGGWFGVGLGQSRAKWAYLPHAESDFIFAIIGEELGFIGAGLVVALYVTLALVGLRIARRNVDPFIKLVAATSTAWLVGQAAINIFYVIGLLPVTGLTLPMISAGGTSLVVTMAIFGLLANFARREPQAMAALQHSGPGVVSRFFGIGVPAVGGEIEKAPVSPARAAKQQRREERRAARRAARPPATETPRTPATQRPPDRRDDRGATGRRAPEPVRRRPAGPAPRTTGAPVRRPDGSRAVVRPGATPVPGTTGGVRGWLGFGSDRPSPPVGRTPADARGHRGERPVETRDASRTRDGATRRGRADRPTGRDPR
ncbi:putative lipid II flippase FtsW [Nakamurella deserti]|uniref:putative lipid II flippase FtsW n=1 Tax=Nakamurella deserti TaxID=2164074 RepID=UPI000DBE3ADE|nr:putative lipid II flippase FtsW [Nakamurella deserti]